jgi:polar amino acid transport system substrate-binding protein
VAAPPDPDFAPQSSVDDQNVFSGFDIDVATELAKRLGAKVSFVTPGWDVIVGGKWKGQWDVSVGSMAPTRERREVLAFPAVYYTTPAVLVARADDGTIGVPADAAGKTLGVVPGTTYESYLRGDLVIDAPGAPDVAYAFTGAKIRPYQTERQAIADLAAGRGLVDGVVLGLPTALLAIKDGAGIKVVAPALYAEPLAIAIDKGDPAFGQAIADAIAAMKADGTLKAMSERWYGADLTAAP